MTMPKYSLGKATAVLAAMAVLPVTVAVTDAEAAAVASTTCTFRPQQHVVEVTMTGNESSASIKRGSDDRLLVNADLCVSGAGKAATVQNTKVVRVVGESGEQSLLLDLSGGAFAPGFGDETGTSDEIEFDLRLKAGSDYVHVMAGDTGVNVRAGTNRKGKHTLNLNADEVNGVDADVRLRGVERLHFHGGMSDDRFIASGGLGTGGAFKVRVRLQDEVGGNDLLVGGRRADEIIDHTAVVDSDTLRGGGGDDTIYSYDADNTGDLVDAGRGIDTCAFNELDVVLNCELTPAN